MTTGAFQLEQRRFWLYPTYVHQQQSGIKPEALPLLEQAVADRPPAGMVRLAHFAEVTRQFLYYLDYPTELPRWEKANMLAKYHVTTEGVRVARQR